MRSILGISLRTVAWVTYFAISLIDLILTIITRTLTYTQFWIILIGAMSAYGVIESMTKKDLEGSLKIHQITFTLTLTLAVVFLTAFLFVVETDNPLSVLTLFVVGISLWLALWIIKWHERKKLNKNLLTISQ